MQEKVLLVGNDGELLQSRVMLVQNAGLVTTTAHGTADWKACGSDMVAVVVLCHTLDAGAKLRMIARVRENSPKAMVLHLLKPGSQNELPEHASNTIVDGPAQLVSKVSDLMQRWREGRP